MYDPFFERQLYSYLTNVTLLLTGLLSSYYNSRLANGRYKSILSRLVAN